MAAILGQLGLNETFFIQFGIICFIFVYLGAVYFKPFQKLIESRDEKTIRDKQAAESLMSQANAKFEEYHKKFAEERQLARKEYENLVDQAKREEAEILNHARSEARKITQGTLDSIEKQRIELKQQIESDVESLARLVSEQLLSSRQK